VSESDLLSTLPDTFRFGEALERINERQFRRLLSEGRITRLARGIYRKTSWTGDDDLVEIAAKSTRATIALRSALARHDLIDDIPSALDIAVPRGAWTPALTIPINWHHFDRATFDVGREDLNIGDQRSIGIYSAERSIIDAFRLRHLEGEDMGNEALKQWLRKGGQPSALLKIAQSFPKARSALHNTLSILL
jgi:predicted transcriptional regulator of viral defense system